MYTIEAACPLVGRCCNHVLIWQAYVMRIDGLQITAAFACCSSSPTTMQCCLSVSTVGAARLLCLFFGCVADSGQPALQGALPSTTSSATSSATSSSWTLLFFPLCLFVSSLSAVAFRLFSSLLAFARSFFSSLAAFALRSFAACAAREC